MVCHGLFLSAAGCDDTLFRSFGLSAHQCAVSAVGQALQKTFLTCCDPGKAAASRICPTLKKLFQEYNKLEESQ